MNQKKDNWTIESIWNTSLVVIRGELEPRSKIWASDIGKHFWGRYQQMMGVKYTDPYDERTLRKFAAGNYFEDLITYVLETIGILKAKQEYITIEENDKHLKITGKSDLRAGGITDWKQARQNILSAKFPEAIERISLKLVDYFTQKYPEGLKEVIFEVKSVNSQVFWSKKDYLIEAYPHHALQLYTYLKHFKHPEGRMLYISKDDLTIKEIIINYPNEELEEAWKKDVMGISAFYRAQKEPPKPDDIIFDKRKKHRFSWNKTKHIIIGCYDKNWEVHWSPYFQLLTGMKDKEKWEKETWGKALKINNEMKEKFKQNPRMYISGAELKNGESVDYSISPDNKEVKSSGTLIIDGKLLANTSYPKGEKK